VDRAEISTVRAGELQVGYERTGDESGWPVVLLHGFPYDVRSYDRVAAILADAGADVVVPYLRGFGPTAFADPSTLRSGQQAALAHDLRSLIEALALRRPIVGGFDWGGRAACLTAALWPETVAGLVTVGGYNVQNIAMANTPASPEVERDNWYQYYLHGERGRQGLNAHRAELTRLLWDAWSPTWKHTDADFQASAGSFDNPAFVDVVVHSYRHRYGLAPGDSAYERTESLIAEQPAITVPTIVIDSLDDTIMPPQPVASHAAHFTSLVDYRQLATGHNTPQEDPDGFADAVVTLHRARRA
jgi:pimeloyl-ACP methyl ester carboxylesterase